ERGRVFDSASNPEPMQFHLEVLRAIDLLGLRPEIKNVVEHAFPEKCGAAVVPDLEAALHLSLENQSRIYVTTDGEMVINGRLIVTGAQAGQRGTSLLGLKREIKELRIQGETLGLEQARLTGEMDGAEQKLAGMEGEAAALDAELREHEKAAAARNSQLEGLARDLERAEQHVRVVGLELEQAADERREHETREEEVAAELASAESSRLNLQASLGERLQAARAEMRRIESETEELNSRINRNRLELYESHGRIEELTVSQTEAAGALARFDAERSSLDESIGAASEELQTARARTDELETMLSEMRQAVSAAHDRRSQFEVERARIESEAEHLARACFSELAMSLEDVVTSVEISGQWPEGSGQLEDIDKSQVPSGDDDGNLESGSGPELTTDHQPLTTDPDHRPLTTDSDSARTRLD